MPLSTPETMRPLLAAPVAIFGGGTSGRAVLALLGKLGVPGVVFDEKATGKDTVNNFGPAAAASSRLVVFSPGFRPDHPWLATARQGGCKCLGELDFASLFWRGSVIAITGTNGKTTLTEFLTHALRSVGHDATATGNIGHPFSQLVADTDAGTLAAADKVAVCEVSSFQAETLRHFHADATLWTNFAEDHLERHPGLDAYFAAKWALTGCTTPGAFFAGTSVTRFAQKSGRTLAPSAIVLSEGKTPHPRLAGTVFGTYPQHENFLLAAAWWKHAGLAEEDLLAAAGTFQPGRHRLARVAGIEGVTWWNDSKATNFHAVEAALASFAQPVLLIAGGKGKGGDLEAFVRRIAPRVRQAFLLGETSRALAGFCAANQVPHVVCADLAEAVRRAAAAARPGEHVLLSPGFASFDLFRSYEDRGNQFESLVSNLAVTPTLR
ncbi:MAG TPA: UDP-N-acetylmuramoyl-L-alanine--D-glutamate ligase [Opitutaceae bacterium]|nr:UDP-N-acetylmuramoyl-L-alanine--D-glutamate ligase [Opitutaceae bacterium]